LIAFATATALEVGGYFIPWLDNLLDTVATPASIVAASIITASQLGDTSPFLKWSLAIIAGGGVCAVVQTGTVVTRAASTGLTAGLGNVGISFVELICSIVFTAFAIVLPIVGVLALFVVLSILVRRILTRKISQPQPAAVASESP
jgi:hypothetical protein